MYKDVKLRSDFHLPSTLGALFENVGQMSKLLYMSGDILCFKLVEAMIGDREEAEDYYYHYH